MPKMGSQIDIAVAAVQCFADDGTLDMQELDKLLSIALADINIDDDERRVLASVFDRITPAQVDDDVWARIQDFRQSFAI